MAADTLYPSQAGDWDSLSTDEPGSGATSPLQPTHGLCCARRPGQQVAGCPSFLFSTGFRESSKRGPLSESQGDASGSGAELIPLLFPANSHHCLRCCSIISSPLCNFLPPQVPTLQVLIPALDDNGAPPGPLPGWCACPPPNCHECGLLTAPAAPSLDGDTWLLLEDVFLLRVHPPPG